MYTVKEMQELIESMESLRRDGYPWKEIAKLFGYTDRNTAQASLLYYKRRIAESDMSNEVNEETETVGDNE